MSLNRRQWLSYKNTAHSRTHLWLNMYVCWMCHDEGDCTNIGLPHIHSVHSEVAFIYEWAALKVLEDNNIVNLESSTPDQEVSSWMKWFLASWAVSLEWNISKIVLRYPNGLFRKQVFTNTDQNSVVSLIVTRWWHLRYFCIHVSLLWNLIKKFQHCCTHNKHTFILASDWNGHPCAVCLLSPNSNTKSLLLHWSDKMNNILRLVYLTAYLLRDIACQYVLIGFAKKM